MGPCPISTRCGRCGFGYDRRMAGIRTIARIIKPAAPLAALMLWAAPAPAAPVRTAAVACAVAKQRVAAEYHRTLASIPRCDPLRAGDSPPGYYVLALRGWCREEICGSVLIGWFAVEKRTGRVFAWDVGEWRLGAPLGPRR